MKRYRISKMIVFFVTCVWFVGLHFDTEASSDIVVDATPEPVTTETTEAPTGENIADGWDAQQNYYYVNGKVVRGAYLIDGKLYYFDKDGTLYKRKGLRKVNGKYYYVNKDYSLETGVVKVKKKYYYFQNNTGERYEGTGIKKVEGKYYYFTSKHHLKSGWVKKKKNKKYYFNPKTYEAVTGWNYVGKYKYFFDKKGQLCQDVRKKLTKKQNKSYMIKVNRAASCVTVYAKDGDKGYTIPVVSFVCSAGTVTPIGTFSIKDKLRWHELYGPCWGQWCEHLTGTILFHSVPYNKPYDNRSLDVAEYNKLGTIASHGCIRLTAGDAKWIYDNCSIGTKVLIYDNEKDPGPFDKPKAEKLKAKHTWDPTDPEIK